MAGARGPGTKAKDGLDLRRSVARIAAVTYAEYGDCVDVNRKIEDLIASAPIEGDGKSDSLSGRAAHWLFTGRGSVASTVSHILEQDDDLAGEISELASQPWTLATDRNGPCHKLWTELPAIFTTIAEKATKGAEPGVSLSSGNSLLLQMASAKHESRLEYRPSRDGGLVDDKVRVESRRAGRALTDVAGDLAGMTREPLLEPVDWHDPESRVQPLSRCVHVASSPLPHALIASFPYPVLGDTIACAALNRLANAVDLVERLASLCDVKGLRLRQLRQMVDHARDLLWDCPEAQERQHAAALLQLGLLRPAASSLFRLFPFDSSSEMHGGIRTTVRRRIAQGTSAVEETTRALEWLSNDLLPLEDTDAAARSSRRKRRKKRGRPEASREEAKRRMALLEAWQRAGDAGVTRAQFVEDWNRRNSDRKEITVRDLERAQGWHRQRSIRNS